jgi:hypothetical protein
MAEIIKGHEQKAAKFNAREQQARFNKGVKATEGHVVILREAKQGERKAASKIPGPIW